MGVPLPALVWTDVTGSWTDPKPGILLAWRQIDGDRPREKRWQGWVVSAWAGGSKAHRENIYVYQSWTDASHIRFADAPKPRPDLSGYRPVNSDRPR